VFKLFDSDRNGIIEREEWMDSSARGVRLPDFGVSGSVLWSLTGDGAGILDKIKILWGYISGARSWWSLVDAG
jgi:hypothetical protein